VIGVDAHPPVDRLIATLDDQCEIFPIECLAKLKPGSYHAQAVVHLNKDLNYPNAPGDLYGPVKEVTIDPAAGGVVKLEIDKQVSEEETPKDTSAVKFLKLPSKLLTEFHGRPMFLRAAVVLPSDFEKNPDKKYPLRVHIGGYGQRYTSALRMAAQRPSDGPQFLSLMLDGAGPLGDPYQVNSDNHGPYGDAITKELIPQVEEKFRGLGTPNARFTDGHSTGGWVSFALQVFYPEFFNGCWSFCPDPVDFRSYELMNIYKDENAYVNSFGFERPAMRQITGETIYTVRHECQIENVLGRGNRWVLSGKDWGAWNATYGPRGEDGRPKPLWDGKTGAIDRSVVEHWKKYDLRLVLEENWKDLGPKLKGKIHIYSGDCDDYFLNNAVRLLDKFLKEADPPAEATIVFGEYQGHSFHPLSEKKTLEAMWKAYEKKKD
jgi:S-formylglutathione hydrolase FrmB